MSRTHRPSLVEPAAQLLVAALAFALLAGAAALVLESPAARAVARSDQRLAEVHQLEALKAELVDVLRERRPATLLLEGEARVTDSTLPLLDHMRSITATWLIHDVLAPTLAAGGESALARRAEGLPRVKAGDRAGHFAPILQMMADDLRSCPDQPAECRRLRRAIYATVSVTESLTAWEGPAPVLPDDVTVTAQRDSEEFARLVGDALQANIEAGLPPLYAEQATSSLLQWLGSGTLGGR